MSVTFDNYEENTRVMGEFTILRTNPYGFWEIRDSKGRPAKGIESSYTTAQAAAKALQSLSNRKK